MDLTQIKYCVQSNSYITPLLHTEAALNPNLSGFFFFFLVCSCFSVISPCFFLFSLLALTQSLRISRSFHRAATEVTEKDEGEKERASPLSLSHSNQSRYFLHTETLTNSLYAEAFHGKVVQCHCRSLPEQGKLRVCMMLLALFLPYFIS